MKTLLGLCLFTLIGTFAAAAEETAVSFPENQPLVHFTVPDGWLTHSEDGTFQAAASEAMDTLLIVKPLTATKKDGAAAIAEIKAPLDKTYGDAITYDKMEEGGPENMSFYIINAEAKTHTADEGDATSYINSVLITFPDTDKLLLAQFLSTAKGAKENGEAIMSVIQSLTKAE